MIPMYSAALCAAVLAQAEAMRKLAQQTIEMDKCAVPFGYRVITPRQLVSIGFSEGSFQAGDQILGVQVIPDAPPCAYCGRTKQAKAHRTCDGCGAPKGG